MNFESIEKKPKAKRPKAKRIVTQAGRVPDGALTWASKKEKAEQLRWWRRGIGRTFKEQARVIRLAWALEWLFTDEGFAYPNNHFLGRETDIAENKVQDTLALMETAGAIVRVHVWNGQQVQRRIYPGAAVADQHHPDAGVNDHPDIGAIDTPTRGVQNRKNNNRNAAPERFSLMGSASSTLLYAKATAIANETRRTQDGEGTT
jgi:hypothetical protein